MLSFEDKILIKTSGRLNLKDFLPEDSSKNFLTNFEKINIERLPQPHNQFDGAHGRKPSATVNPCCRHRCRN